MGDDVLIKVEDFVDFNINNNTTDNAAPYRNI